MYKLRARKRKPSLLASVGLILAVFGTAVLFNVMVGSDGETHDNNNNNFRGRRLLEHPDTNTSDPDDHPKNCTPPSIHEFPEDFFNMDQRRNGGLVVHVFIVLYIFCALAIVCDDYFVASLEKICNVLKLQSDVAGATFMAAGSSAPELFTSVVGVFVAKSDVGTGTIVGSAVFNILFIIAMCGLFSGTVIYLTWWPMFRDSIFYLLSVFTLVFVILDNKVTWYEAMTMLLLYMVYIILMYFNKPLGDFMITKGEQLKSRCCCKSSGEFNPNSDLDLAEKSPALNTNGHVNEHIKPPNDLVAMVKKRSGTMDSTASKASVYSQNIGFEHHGSVMGSRHSIKAVDDHDDDEYESPFSVPNSIPKKIYWILMMPMNILFALTIPDCRRPGCWQKTFVVTFVMSIVWIAGMSYVMVWMVTIIGYTLGIPDTVMGLTFLAAGTSVPDAMSSLFVARDGYGDMAVSNSIGSNIFDVLLCLGLPWLLHTTAVAWGSDLHIASRGITFTALTLFATVIFLLSAMLLNGWKLNKKLGVLCLLVYAGVITLACLFEMNVFGDINPPTCTTHE